uniref:NifE n=1 Tax=Paenibacillus massiliensis TaxID=225917 RepID=Q56JU2_9BACL|nr:NifE [Paenibacillus massiliensis]
MQNAQIQRIRRDVRMEAAAANGKPKESCGTKIPKGTPCPRPAPGEAAGGCSFDGAQITLLPIADAAHLVHGPIACLGNSWESRGSLSSGPELSAYGLSTDLEEQDIIFGSERKLRESILYIVNRFAPPVVFVYTTCVTALIGEDIDAVCKAETEQLGVPVIPVNSPGFVGSKNLGTRLAGDVLLQHVIGRAEPEQTTPHDINLIGEYNIAGELWHIEQLLQQIGIRILSRITGDGRFREISWAHRAKVNMVVCSRALLGLAVQMERKYGIPYFEGSFYGAKETSYSLRQIAYLTGDREVERKVDKLAAREELRLQRELEPYRRLLKGKRVVLYTGGVKNWVCHYCITGAGNEGSWGRHQQEYCGGCIADCRAYWRLMLIISRRVVRGRFSRRYEVVRLIWSLPGGVICIWPLKEQIPFVDINQERHTAYAGYEGLLTLARQLAYSLEHPVWRLAAKQAPWEEESGNAD